jgi:hypothetical protein
MNLWNLFDHRFIRLRMDNEEGDVGIGSRLWVSDRERSKQ